jgi:hypothetical protein
MKLHHAIVTRKGGDRAAGQAPGSGYAALRAPSGAVATETLEMGKIALVRRFTGSSR